MVMVLVNGSWLKMRIFNDIILHAAAREKAAVAALKVALLPGASRYRGPTNFGGIIAATLVGLSSISINHHQA